MPVDPARIKAGFSDFSSKDGEIIRDEKNPLQRVWTGSVRDLVSWVAAQDARVGFVLDKASGAKIAINISGTDEPAEEPFYIESPDGQNMYDAYNRREAVRILTNIRKGDPFPDISFDDMPRRNKSTISVTGKKIAKRGGRKSAGPALGGMR